jgi:hypothetical protein
VRRTLILSMVLTPALAVVAAAQSESFEMADANADGVLTQAEISAAFGADLVSRILDAEDADGDGILTRAEAEHALAEGADWSDYEGIETRADEFDRMLNQLLIGQHALPAKAHRYRSTESFTTGMCMK